MQHNIQVGFDQCGCKSSCEPHMHSRDGKSVTCLHDEGTNHSDCCPFFDLTEDDHVINKMKYQREKYPVYHES